MRGQLVMDNLNTHWIAPLWKRVTPSGPEKAYALARRLEIHHAPKHGSWLTIAEIDVLDHELNAWTRPTNATSTGDSPSATPASSSGT